MIEQGSRVLISSNRPTPGGVQVMLKFVIDCLLQRGCQITLAYYQPYSVSPLLSVPLPRLLSRRPGTVEDQFYAQHCVGIGCWLPELEITHYRSSPAWKRLIKEHDVHLAVGGSCQPAYVFLQNKVSFLAWVASDWQGDRLHRVQRMPFLRRLLDRFIVAPIARRMEKNIVNTKKLIALSDATQVALNKVSGKTSVREVLPIAIDTEHFKPRAKQGKATRIGFVGRFEDPRKHINLLFDAFAQLQDSLPHLQLCLIGDQLSSNSSSYIKSLGIETQVEVISHVEHTDLPEYLNDFDVFVLPSHQEGLCIAALEAMSCAVPVVSTRCGGPEDFIDNGVNGLLCEHDSEQLAEAVLQLLSDDQLRIRYASAARKTVVNEFSEAVQMARFWTLLDQSFKSDE